jgi:NitT/TauT family transport system ATP-binding protein
MVLDQVSGGSRANDGALCALHGVWREFPMPDGRPRTVLEDISLTIRPNEVVALLGPSGSGKSTILRIMAGLIEPTRGDVVYHDRQLRGLNPGVAMVFQSFALYPWMTVTQNIEIILEAYGLSTSDVRDRTARAIETVGLAGFEDAYPRELSGGMKQRVGIARAFSTSPEMLFMDEPFSQVDALTAESLRAEVLDLWANKETNPSAIVLVSHDIGEVAYMADRIVVLGTNPGRVRTIVDNPLPRPRTYRSPELQRVIDHLHDIITGHELPDAPEPAVEPARPDFEPLPPVPAGEIEGLLEFLDTRNGREDLFRIAADTNRDFGQMIAVAKAAELLDLVETPKRMVVSTELGTRFELAGPQERKEIWRAQIMSLRLFQEVSDLIVRLGEVDETLVKEMMAVQLPQQDYEQMFRTLVGWGRYGEIFAYDEERGSLSAPEEDATA